MDKLVNIQRLQKTCLFLFLVIFVAFSFNSCLVPYKGKTIKTDTISYLKYTNKHLRYSALVPEKWIGEMSIGGSYNVIPDSGNTASISFRSSKFEQFSGIENNESLNLEILKDYFLSISTEDQIGPEFELSINETQLSGQKAYKLEYTYVPKSLNKKLYQIQIFTINEGRVFSVFYYANIDNYEDYLNEFIVVTNSYKILN